jgi:hypothetical protein
MKFINLICRKNHFRPVYLIYFYFFFYEQTYTYIFFNFFFNFMFKFLHQNVANGV